MKSIKNTILITATLLFIALFYSCSKEAIDEQVQPQQTKDTATEKSLQNPKAATIYSGEIEIDV